MLKRPFSLLLTPFVCAVLLTGAGCGDTSSSTSSSSSTTTTTYSLGFATPVSKVLQSGNGGASSCQIVVAADFDQDGKADFAVVNPTQNNLSVFISSGSDFAGESTYATVSAPLALASGDFNGDGKPDLAVISQTSVSILLNDGTGKFPTHVEIATGTDNRSVVCGDFNSDNHIDIAVADAGSTPLHVIFSDGSSTPGGYTTQDFTTTAGTINTPVTVVTGDFNQDGLLDLAFGNGSASYLTLWLNQGGTSLFASSSTQNSGLSLASGNVAAGLAAADLNQDGRPDLIASDTGTSTAEVRAILNETSGMTIATYGLAAVSAPPSSVLAGDYNGDGYVDVAVISKTGLNAIGTAEAQLFVGDGAGDLGTAVRYVATSGQAAAAGATGDFNGDGKPDIVMAGPGGAVVLYNTCTSSTE